MDLEQYRTCTTVKNGRVGVEPTTSADQQQLSWADLYFLLLSKGSYRVIIMSKKGLFVMVVVFHFQINVSSLYH
jgi:hypothetical protein